MRALPFAVAAATGLWASAASAGIIHVSSIGGGIDISSGASPALGAGPGWNPGALATLHTSLASSGIATDGKITFAALDTDHGLAMVALVDRESGSAGVNT